MGTKLVDFHCHLDLYPNLDEIVRRCEAAGIFTLTVTTTPKAWARNHEVTSKTKHVRAALGLHPQLVADRAGEIALFEDLLPQTRYVGEVGLDAGPRYYKSLETQKHVFERVLRACAAAGGKILSVHSVRSAKTVLDMIEANLPADRGQVVLHWFTGTSAEARRAADLGCFFSVNEQMLRNKAGASLVPSLPRSRILTETDGPFTRTGDRPAEPADVGRATAVLAGSLGIDRERAIELVFANLRSLIAA